MTLTFRLFASLVLLGALLMVNAGSPARSAPPSFGPGADRIAATGQWFLNWEDGKKDISLQFRITRGHDHDSWGSQNVKLESLDGLSLDETGPVEFRVQRDAGTFFLRGSLADEKGAGTFELVLDSQFAAELERRGIGRPTEDQQIDLALADMSMQLLDDFKQLGYDKPDVALLVRCAQHGVNRPYVKGMGELGLQLSSIEQLIEARDHGVDPHFIRGMQEAGYQGLDYAELLRARDHGADPNYIAGMKELGFDLGSLNQVIEARDHGVDPHYVQAMATAGYHDVGLKRLIQARDHGVDPSWVSAMKKAGYSEMTLEDAIRARDHGVDGRYANYVNRSVGRQVTLNELIRYRDQGWSPD